MKALVTILETNFEVEWDFEITASGSPESWSIYGGDPAESAEFEIDIISLRNPSDAADVYLDIPKWLNELLATDLSERDDINQIIQRADQDRASYDPDDERI